MSLAPRRKATSRAIVVLASLVSLAAGSGDLAAQTPLRDPHAAQPQRPSVGTHAATMAPGWVEIEAGIELDRNDDRSRGAIAPLVAKVGLARRVQLEAQLPVMRPPGEASTGLGDFSIGVKWRVLDAAPILGDVAILPTLKTPSGSPASRTGTGTTDLSVVLISSHAFGEVAMDLNVGYTRRDGDGAVAPRDASLWAASFGGPLRGRLGWAAEFYGYPATTGPSGASSIVAFLGGLTIEVREWLVLDAGVIAPATGPQPRAIYAGFVYNLGRLR